MTADQSFFVHRQHFATVAHHFGLIEHHPDAGLSVLFSADHSWPDFCAVEWDPHAPANSPLLLSLDGQALLYYLALLCNALNAIEEYLSHAASFVADSALSRAREIEQALRHTFASFRRALQDYTSQRDSHVS
jgi:hypothetical protein